MLRELVICGVLASVAAATVATEDRLSFDLPLTGRVIGLTASFDSGNWLSFVLHVGNTIDVGVPSFVRANCPIPSNAWTGRERVMGHVGTTAADIMLLKPLASLAASRLYSGPPFCWRPPAFTMVPRFCWRLLASTVVIRFVGGLPLNAGGS